VLRPPVPIESLTVLNPDRDTDTVKDRGVVLDVRVRLRDGSQVDVEMRADKRVGPVLRKRWQEIDGLGRTGAGRPFPGRRAAPAPAARALRRTSDGTRAASLVDRGALRNVSPRRCRNGSGRADRT
jgi:hypothetical protein